jgi:hypothetical protein
MLISEGLKNQQSNLSILALNLLGLDYIYHRVWEENTP